MPTHVLIPKRATDALDSDSIALAEQVEALDKKCFICYKGHVWDQQIMSEITQALQIQIGVYEQYNNT